MAWITDQREVWLAACLGLAAIAMPGAAWAAAAAAQCGPSLLGSPCAADGVATQAEAGSSTSLAVGNPVNLATGNKYQREIDLPPAPGLLGIELVRHYNARDVRTEALGRNWVWSYDTRVFKVGDTVQIVQADGSRVDFARHPGSTTCLPADPALGVLHVHAGVRGETMSWQWRDGRVLRFDEDGYLVGISVASGQAVSIRRARDGSRHRGALLEVVDPRGRRLDFRYGAAAADGWRPLQAVDTPAGTFTYAQDDARRLSTAMRPAGEARDYLYEAGAAAWLTGIVDRGPGQAPLRVRSWAYDARGRVVAATRGAPDAPTGRMQIDYADGRTTVRDAAGVTRLLHRQAGARTVLAAVEGDGCEGCAPVDGSRRYDPWGRLTQAQGIGATRDVLGRVTTLRDAGGTTRVAWLGDSTLPTQVDTPSETLGQRHTRHIAWLSFADPATGLWRAVPKRIAETGWRPGAAGPRAIGRAWLLDWRIERGVATLTGVAPDTSDIPGPVGQTVLARAADPARTMTAAAASLPRIPGWPDLRWRRDDFGLPVRAEGVAGKPVAGAETRDYDVAGRLVAREFADGTRWTYTYDTSGRLHTHRAARAGETIDTQLGWQDGLPVRIDHPVESERRAYGPDGRMASREVTRPAAEGTVGAGVGDAAWRYAEAFGWDAQGRMTRHELPEGGTLFYDWSATGLAAIRYGPTDGPVVAVFEQIAGQTGVARRWFNGISSGSQARRSLHYRGRDGVLLGLIRQADRQGRVLAEAMYRPGRAAGAAMPSPGIFASHRYGYDEAGRLIVARHAGGVGGVGTTPALWSRPATDYYAWREGGQPAAIATQGLSVRPTRMHESGGLPVRADGYALRYGPARRLAAVDRGGAVVARYRHNAFGERVVREVGDAAPTHDFYLGQRLVAEQGDGPAGTIARRYIYAGHEVVAILEYPGGRPMGARTGVAISPRWIDTYLRPARQAPPAARLFAVHPDATGTPRLVTDADQRERWRGDFGPFGALRRETGDIALRLRLPGQVADPETGWHDNYLRTYDPLSGSYLEPDPLGAEPGTEAYGYAAQQPARFIDPLGLLLFAFDGTDNSPASRTNIFLMKGWYQDQEASAAGIAPEYYVWGPGSQEGSVLPGVDVAVSYTAKARLDEQWKNLLGALAKYSGTRDKPVQIDIIGFSRGSALARQFANTIGEHIQDGLFSARTVPLIGKLVTACVNLRFLGVFDTVPQMFVGATDIASNFSIGAGWDQVAHATALHETRQLFPLTTMQAGANGFGAPASPVTEIGLIGSHSDLGGGYFYDDNGARMGDLSNVSLNWMMLQALEAGVQFGNLPTTYRYVNDPSLHAESDYRIPQIPAVFFPTDRWVNSANSVKMYDRQELHPLLGKALRDQVNAFITPVERWKGPTGPVVGRVDIDAYRAWLDETLGLRLLASP